jgi:hypothetical protein
LLAPIIYLRKCSDTFPNELKNITSFSTVYHVSSLFRIDPNPPLKELTWTYWPSYNLDDIKEVNRFVHDSQTLEKMTIVMRGTDPTITEFIRLYPDHFQLRNARQLKELNIKFHFTENIETRNINRLLEVIYNDVKENGELLNRLTINGYSLRSALKQSERKDLPNTIRASSPEDRRFSIVPIKYMNKF